MQANQITQMLLSDYKLRISRAMADYVLGATVAPAAGGLLNGMIPVIGGHSKTGVPMRVHVSLDKLIAATSAIGPNPQDAS